MAAVFSRPSHTLTGLAKLLNSAFFAVVTAANLSTSAHPAPALLGFFEGGG